MTDEADDRSSYAKYPTFDGNKDKWPFYKTKMEASLARVDLGEVLTEAYGNHIPTTSDALPEEIVCG